MNCTADNSINRHFNLRSFALALLLGALALTALAAPRAVVQPTGVRNCSCPQRLNEKQLQQVQESLRHKSGFMELGFDERGALTLGNRGHIRGGSATARALLIAAVDSQNLYELESHERSPEVAFARIDESVDRLIVETGQRLTIYQVQLDFADFSRLSGAREAKASFDIGIALLHELVHGVLKLPDPQGVDQIGECDARVNQMRRELQLPERLYYHPGISVTRTLNGTRIVCARLEFVERQAGQAQPSAKYSLTWLPSQVSPNAPNIAGLQQGLLASQRP
ncbi:MAG: hypothetical protein ACREBD_35875 [Blastocatellia bacterium]